MWNEFKTKYLCSSYPAEFYFNPIPTRLPFKIKVTNPLSRFSLKIIWIEEVGVVILRNSALLSTPLISLKSKVVETRNTYSELNTLLINCHNLCSRKNCRISGTESTRAKAMKLVQMRTEGRVTPRTEEKRKRRTRRKKRVITRLTGIKVALNVAKNHIKSSSIAVACLQRSK